MTDTERELPITGDWLGDEGFRRQSCGDYDCCWITGRMQVGGVWEWWFGASYLGEIYQQRGEVLDLLAALKIKAKEPNE